MQYIVECSEGRELVDQHAEVTGKCIPEQPDNVLVPQRRRHCYLDRESLDQVICKN